MIAGAEPSIGFAVGALLTGIWDANLNCTHPGSALGTSDRVLRAQAPNAQFLESLSVVGTEADRAKAQIENWVWRLLNR